MWAFPYLTYVAIGFILLMMAGMLFDTAGRSQMVASLVVAAVVIALGVYRGRTARRAAAPSAEDQLNRTGT